ncbi:MAG: hypothetical protein H0W81_01245 [Chloroflexi bacterium]|nr:hypothetical protein [Chloroflexota bacterium]
MVPLLDRPENAGALSYLAHGRPADEATFGPPPEDLDSRHLGTHPTVVDRLWEDLNRGLPVDARWLVFDGPALIHPDGTILAAAMGTQYALRLLPDDRAAAIAAGAESVHHFQTVGTTLDLPEAFGPEWVFGRFDDREPAWLLASYQAIAPAESASRHASV